MGGSLFFFRDFADFHPFDALACFFQYFETPAVEIDAFADFGQVFQFFHNQAGYGMEGGIFFLRRQVELGGEFDIFERTVYGEAVGLAVGLQNGFFGAFELFRNSPAMVSSRSFMVTMPSTAPNSSTTNE